jgi:hypothetical protein
MVPHLVSALSKVFSGTITGVDYGGTFLANFLAKSSAYLDSAMEDMTYQYGYVDVPLSWLTPVSMGKPSSVRRAGFNETCCWCQYELTTGEIATITAAWGSGEANPNTVLLCPQCGNSLLDITRLEIAIDMIFNILKLVVMILLVKNFSGVIKQYMNSRGRKYRKLMKEKALEGVEVTGDVKTDVETLADAILMLEGDSPFVEYQTLINEWLLYIADPLNRSRPL